VIIVNGEGITNAELEAELVRYEQAQSALGISVTNEEAKKTVSEEFINELLLSQGSESIGYVVDDSALQYRYEALAAQVGGIDKLKAWQNAHGYTEATFRSALRRQLAAAFMRDRLAASVPATAEQVHVKHILLSTEKAAREALVALKAGWEFTDLVARYDPVVKGELGWFPRGYLPDAVIEQAAFSLEPGQYSDIIQTQAGFDILFLVARDPAKALSPDALVTLQEHAIEEWLMKSRNESSIQIK
jgi:peptidyl-prolyl cis-trans isomerase C